MKAIVIALVAASGLFAGSLQVGEPLKQEHEISLHDLTAKPNKYVGKTFQVKGQMDHADRRQRRVDPHSDARG